MLFYEAEKCVPDLVKKMRANSSIAYSAKVDPWEPNPDRVKRDLAMAERMNAKASISDDDLFYTKSILVSTNWNANDDVFDKAETWAARHTPSHKPTNIGHDEKVLVGHITDVWAMDDEGIVIADDSSIDDLPDLFHLVNGAVIYTNWRDDDLTERTEALIEEIQAGDKYVSMECLFSNFNYAMTDSDGKCYVVARDKDTSFLTKHLRAYGGKGVYKDYKLGRLIRNITFSGKGYVDKPANKESVIISSGKSFAFSLASSKKDFSEESGVSYSYGSNHETLEHEGKDNMSDLLQKQNEKLEAQLSKLQDQLEKVTAQANEAGLEKLQNQISALETELAEAKKSYEDEKKKNEDSEKSKAELQSDFDSLKEENSTLAEEVGKMKSEAKAASRVSTLVDGGFSKDEAIAKVETFASLSDDQFEAVASEIVEAKKSMSKKDKDEDEEKKKDDSQASETSEDVETDPAEENANASVIEDTQAEEDPNLSADPSDEGDALADTRAELGQALAHFLNSGASDDSADTNS